MLDKNRLNLISQLLAGMEEAVEKLEASHKEKNTEEFERAKKEIIEFQRKLTKEIG